MIFAYKGWIFTECKHSATINIKIIFINITINTLTGTKLHGFKARRHPHREIHPHSEGVFIYTGIFTLTGTKLHGIKTGSHPHREIHPHSEGHPLKDDSYAESVPLLEYLPTQKSKY